MLPLDLFSHIFPYIPLKNLSNWCSLNRKCRDIGFKNHFIFSCTPIPPFTNLKKWVQRCQQYQLKRIKKNFSPWPLRLKFLTDAEWTYFLLNTSMYGPKVIHGLNGQVVWVENTYDDMFALYAHHLTKARVRDLVRTKYIESWGYVLEKHGHQLSQEVWDYLKPHWKWFNYARFLQTYGMILKDELFLELIPLVWSHFSPEEQKNFLFGFINCTWATKKVKTQAILKGIHTVLSKNKFFCLQNHGCHQNLKRNTFGDRDFEQRIGRLRRFYCTPKRTRPPPNLQKIKKRRTINKK